MKKILYAAALAALLPLALSCGKQNNPGDTSFDEPRFVQSAGKLIPASGNLKSIDLSESGLYVVGEIVGGTAAPVSRHPGTKADGEEPEVVYTTGTYEVNGTRYDLKGWGWIEFVNTASGEVVLKYKGPNDAAEVTVTATFSKSTVNNDLYRSWRVNKTRVSIIETNTTYSAEFDGCDFNKIADFFKDNGHAISDKIPANHRVSTFSITGAGSLFIIYSDGKSDVGSCTVSGSTLSYDWKSNGMGYSFETGRASFSFMDGKCIFVIEAKLDGNAKAAVKLVLDEIE